jgi:hypothetical protein
MLFYQSCQRANTIGVTTDMLGDPKSRIFFYGI